MGISGEAVLLQRIIDELLNKLEPGDSIYTSTVECSSLSGTASASGNTTLVTPASGKHLRIFYVSYNPTTATTAAFRFGEAGTLWFKNAVPAKSIVAKDWNARHLAGAVDEPLILNLADAVSTNWNVFYNEV